MELALMVVGGYMATVLAFGWLRGWHRGPRSITRHTRRQPTVLRIDRRTFKVV